MILDDLVAVTKIRLARHQRQQSLADFKTNRGQNAAQSQAGFSNTLKTTWPTRDR